MAPDVSLTMVTDTDDAAVLGVELADRMVPSDAAIFTESYDNLVLEYSFGVNKDRLPVLVVRRSSRSELFRKPMNDYRSRCTEIWNYSESVIVNEISGILAAYVPCNS